ncbi:MAG TPA: transglutaminase family protein [Methylococcaceae bacterium]|nr:transglutaminase family protein [Methylococcaceae bacterium]
MKIWPPFVGADDPSREERDGELFDAAVQAHDAQLTDAGLDIWLGAEPTFTDRTSVAPEWLYVAEGEDKRQRAELVLADLGGLFVKPAVLRTIGRQYPEEDRPRWNYGLYAHRSGRPLWCGPPDPALGGTAVDEARIEPFWQHLAGALERHGWGVRTFVVESPLSWRIIGRPDGQPPPEPGTERRLRRPAIQEQAIPPEGLVDDLAREGNYLFALHQDGGRAEGQHYARLELPDIKDVPLFLACLDLIAATAGELDVQGLILTGYPPPVDDSVCWMTLTPDPAVLEINMAPASSAAQLLAWLRVIFRSADVRGLSAYRFHYNGDFTDSGGGGQITYGGPTPKASPFFRFPQLLPRIVGYFNQHPALSYFFTQEAVGSSSQSPRVDERTRDDFKELAVALDLLHRQASLQPETLHQALAPFLTDLTGNTHRSELNIEKLWNLMLPGRGCLGLVEFRAFRMAPSPEMLIARACLFRAILAMLARCEDPIPLNDWGDELHDRFALPFYLRQDLHVLLKQLEIAGFGLEPPLVEPLLGDDYRLKGEIELPGVRLRVERALEFWPLIGDAASQEAGGSRLVDSSAARIQVTLQPQPGLPDDLGSWRVAVNGWSPPLRRERDPEGPILLFAFRYRSFMPWRGLHPTLGPQGPVTIQLHRPDLGRSWKLTLHDWKPEGGAYPGLPSDWPESAARRQERLVIEVCESDQSSSIRCPPSNAVTPYCLDLRRLP